MYRSKLLLAGILFAAVSPAATFLGPTPYLSFADSPFNGGLFSSFTLQTFESGSMATTGVTISPGAVVLAPSAFTDSVDADDGAIDGSGTGGHSLYTAFTLSTIRFTFDAAVLGALPTHAGIVWTDVGNVTSGTSGFGGVTFQAFGPGLVSLGSIGPFTLGDGNALGGTAEDRFFGVTDPGGIAAIEISMNNSTDWEVDHLQFGTAASTAVPEPTSMLLVGIGILGLIAQRRRLQ